MGFEREGLSARALDIYAVRGTFHGVVTSVVGLRLQPQVPDVVVRLVLVVVMNFFAGFEQTPELVLHQHTVQRVQALGVPAGMRGVGAGVSVTAALADRDDGEGRTSHGMQATTR